MLNQKTMAMFPQNCNMLVKVLSYINSDEGRKIIQQIQKKNQSKKQSESKKVSDIHKYSVYEILRTSMQLSEVQEDEDDYESDYFPVPYEEAYQSQQSTQKSQQSQNLKSPLQTFTQHFQNQNRGQPGRLFTLTDETEQTVDDRKPTHVRGPSKIQEILQDLQANVADDIMKMANDLIKFTENSANTNESAKFIPSDKKSIPPLSEKKNLQPIVENYKIDGSNTDYFKVLNKQQGGMKSSYHQQHKSENLNIRICDQLNQQRQYMQKVNSQPNVADYNSNNTKNNSHQNTTNSSLQKVSPLQTQSISSKLNYHNKSNSSLQCDQNIKPCLPEQFSSQISPKQQTHQSEKRSNQINRDSLFSKKSKQHYIDEFDINFNQDYERYNNENNEPIESNQLNNEFDYFEVNHYAEEKENQQDQSPNMNVSKRLERDNISTQSNSDLKNYPSDQKSYQDFCEPCQKTQESDSKQQSTSAQKKKVKRRKKSRIPKNIKYFLDIIEEQSNDQQTPDKSLMESSEELDTIQSVPNFGESAHFEMNYRSDRKNMTISEGNKIQMRIQDPNQLVYDMQSSDSFDHPNSTMINQTLVNFEDVDQILNQVQGYKTLRSKNMEEEAILASWSRVCNEIIRKNLLPVTLDLERIQNQLEYQQQNSYCQKRFHLNRKTTQRTEQNSFIENSCVIGTDNQQLEKSQTDIQIDEIDEIGLLNQQFSPNFSDVCKTIQFAGGDDQKILQRKSPPQFPLCQQQLFNKEFDQQQLNFQF